jgi:ribonuclease P protein component
LTGAGDEAHVPAEQPPSCKDTRLPASDAHPGGARGNHEPPRKGSHSPLGLTRMLPAANRLRRHQDIVETVRRGRRISSGCLVVHVTPSSSAQTRVAFAVGRKVGPSVTRSKVTRRLRHQFRELLPEVPLGFQIVVRALPAAAAADSARLGADLRSALRSVAGMTK